jgi:sarcosine oxidase
VVTAEETAAIRRLAGRFLPDADGPPVEQAVCLYTNTPDHHFLLGALPWEPRVILASACSGHGFKFAPAIGEAVAELVANGRTSLDLSPFAPGRLPAA